MKSMFGCLPVLIQMPVLFALYSALKWPVYNHLTQYPDFYGSNYPIPIYS